MVSIRPVVRGRADTLELCAPSAKADFQDLHAGRFPVSMMPFSSAGVQDGRLQKHRFQHHGGVPGLMLCVIGELFDLGVRAGQPS